MSRPRRDPRAERKAHAVPAARPRFDLGATPSAPPPRPRRDPRRALAAATVRDTPRLRLDRMQGESRPVAEALARPLPRPEAPAVRRVEAPAFHVLAVLDAPDGRLSRLDRQVLAAARILADARKDEAGAVLALGARPVEGAGAAGADRLALLPALGADDPALALAALRAVDEALAPRHVLFGETGVGGDLARRLAVARREPVMTAIEHFTARAVARPTKGRRAERAGPPPRLMTLGEDRVADYAGLPCEARPLDMEVPAVPAEAGVWDVETIVADPASLGLSDSDFVVSAGNGVTDFEGFGALARALGATPGASRVVCDAGLMPREAQVGASGTVLAANCYLALGIAGAPQHLQGIAGCEHVVAVNTDLHAAMVERAGLAIVQDAQAVIPALLALLAQRRGGRP
ncbi:electron transfer flavoprotein subunit alpha/FixB family protein [Aurantimonas sp. Leaf443]|uniref:electron transfer flavoprotein subunit alpha/FixB family protein n=1 Tax=Aurantimonas sp. Leaf443 TaxID=1736378 RepID=UPI0006FBE497|nr:electron transfer flavoprotein subunit alpha/FixB family protein [Aurantimonas sp. Leaf443]KQT87488.1 hypothetical protein ASG48_16990 [Aurantimonas sp. Leaf443]